MEELNEREKSAKFATDCNKSIGEIIDLKKRLSVLQSFVETGDPDKVFYMAEKCCKNPIIYYSKDELPFAGLMAVQDSILSGISQLSSAFSSDKVKGLFDIAYENKVSEVIRVCNEAQKTLENMKGV